MTIKKLAKKYGLDVEESIGMAIKPSKYNLTPKEKQDCLGMFIKPQKKKISKNGRHLEKSFQSEWTRSVKDYFRRYKIPFLYRKYPDNTVIEGTDIRINNWYDCFARFRGKHVAMELKISLAVNIINFKTLFKDREHELDYLEKEDAVGGSGYVILNHYCRKGKHNINTVYALHVNYARQLYKIGSVHIDEVKKIALEINKTKKRMSGRLKYQTAWELKEFFNLVKRY